MSVRFLSVCVVLLCFTSNNTKEPIRVPLSEIWANDMPGTLRLHDLANDPKRDHPLFLDIAKEHSYKRGKKPAGPALAVEGTGLEALENAHAIITGRKPRPAFLLQDHQISISFFTLYSGYYVHLTKVTRSQHTIEVRYEFIPHTSRELTQHFALIPMGKLPKGKFKVDVVSEPFAQRFIDKNWKEFDDEKKTRIISSSFEFDVR